jgi:hypothetical protein
MERKRKRKGGGRGGKSASREDVGLRGGGSGRGREEGGRRKEERGKRKEERGKRKEERGKRKEERGKRKEEGGRRKEAESFSKYAGTHFSKKKSKTHVPASKLGRWQLPESFPLLSRSWSTCIPFLDGGRGIFREFVPVFGQTGRSCSFRFFPPSHPFLPTSRTNPTSFFDHVGRTFGFSRMEDFYSLSVEKLSKFPAGDYLIRKTYGGSVVAALTEVRAWEESG